MRGGIAWFNADYLGERALLDGEGKKWGVEKREKQGEGKLTEEEEQEERADSERTEIHLLRKRRENKFASSIEQQHEVHMFYSTGRC